MVTLSFRFISSVLYFSINKFPEKVVASRRQGKRIQIGSTLGGFYRGAFSLRPTWRMSDSQAAATSKSSTSHIKLPLWLCTGGGNEGGGVIWRGQRGRTSNERRGQAEAAWQLSISIA